jgi:Leucine-rich repeat (LRR) protein
VINLKIVFLADNKLAKLPNNMFSSQSGLIGFDLAQNYLTKFDFSTVRHTKNLKLINLAYNNIQSLQNVTIWKLNQKITINVTDNKWNCFYAQLLEETAIKRKYELIGKIINCSINWLTSTNEKVMEEQKKDIASLGKRLNKSLEFFDSEITKLNRTFDEQAETINMMNMNLSEMGEIVNNTKTRQKKIFEDYIKGKANINPWIIIVILMATTILTVIAGALAVSFGKNYRTQYRFEAVKDSMQE